MVEVGAGDPAGGWVLGSEATWVYQFKVPDVQAELEPCALRFKAFMAWSTALSAPVSACCQLAVCMTELVFCEAT